MITDSKGAGWGYGDERGEEIIYKEVQENGCACGETG